MTKINEEYECNVLKNLTYILLFDEVNRQSPSYCDRAVVILLLSLKSGAMDRIVEDIGCCKWPSLEGQSYSHDYTYLSTYRKIITTRTYISLIISDLLFICFLILFKVFACC